MKKMQPTNPLLGNLRRRRSVARKWALAPWERELLGTTEVRNKHTLDVLRKKQRIAWRQQIGAAVRTTGMTYDQFMSGLHGIGEVKDREFLAQMAVANPHYIVVLAEKIKQS